MGVFTVDLGQVYDNITSITDYKETGAPITYTGKIQVSENGTSWTTLFNGTTSSQANFIALKGFQQGITTINADGIKVEHGSSNQYSMMRADGFVRKWVW